MKNGPPKDGPFGVSSSSRASGYFGFALLPSGSGGGGGGGGAEPVVLVFPGSWGVPDVVGSVFFSPHPTNTDAPKASASAMQRRFIL
jgi:hypothetical protein